MPEQFLKRCQDESAAGNYLLDCLAKYPKGLSAELAAGAALKVAIMLARELSPGDYASDCRQALENVLAELGAIDSAVN